MEIQECVEMKTEKFKGFEVFDSYEFLNSVSVPETLPSLVDASVIAEELSKIITENFVVKRDAKLKEMLGDDIKEVNLDDLPEENKKEIENILKDFSENVYEVSLPDNIKVSSIKLDLYDEFYCEVRNENTKESDAKVFKKLKKTKALPKNASRFLAWLNENFI
jgi:hypothetical protein